MRILLTAFAIMLATASASAQGVGGMGNLGGNDTGGRHQSQQKKTEKTAPKPKADDKAYNAALKGLPDKPYDPWHGVH